MFGHAQVWFTDSFDQVFSKLDKYVARTSEGQVQRPAQLDFDLKASFTYTSPKGIQVTLGYFDQRVVAHFAPLTAWTSFSPLLAFLWLDDYRPSDDLGFPYDILRARAVTYADLCPSENQFLREEIVTQVERQLRREPQMWKTDEPQPDAQVILRSLRGIVPSLPVERSLPATYCYTVDSQVYVYIPDWNAQEKIRLPLSAVPAQIVDLMWNGQRHWYVWGNFDAQSAEDLNLHDWEFQSI